MCPSVLALNTEFLVTWCTLCVLFLISVSRFHFLIKRDGPDYFIRDLSSVNGVYINDVKLGNTNFHLLHEGDKLRFSPITNAAKRIMVKQLGAKQLSHPSSDEQEDVVTHLSVADLHIELVFNHVMNKMCVSRMASLEIVANFTQQQQQKQLQQPQHKTSCHRKDLTQGSTDVLPTSTTPTSTTVQQPVRSLFLAKCGADRTKRDAKLAVYTQLRRQERAVRIAQRKAHQLAKHQRRAKRSCLML